MLSEIRNKQIDLLKREQDDLDRRINMDQEEIKKIAKITEKYQQNLEKQAEKEQVAIQHLNLQEEELKALHDESKSLAQELKQERSDIAKDKHDKKLKLQALYNFDERMQKIKDTIATRDRQIGDLNKEKDAFDLKIDQARLKLNKA